MFEKLLVALFDERVNVSKAPQSQGMTKALSVTQKPPKMTLTFLGIFFAPSSSKKKCFRAGFAIYMECSKTDRICHCIMDFEKCLILR